MNDRVAKAIEVKTALNNLGITDSVCENLKLFSVILNDWVKDGDSRSGKIKLIEIRKKLVYNLCSPKNTFVKLVD